MKSTLSIIIVTWNNEKDIKFCLESLKDQSFKDFNIILVDNASKDKTIEVAKKTFPEIQVIKQDKNYYLCKSNNDGIKFAFKEFNPEYIMVLNADTKLEKDTIKILLKEIKKNPKTAAVGPKIKFWNNKNEGLLNSTGLIYDGFLNAYDRGFMEEDKGQYDTKEFVKAVSGACIVYRSIALKKVGLYWEPIKLYLDELELAIRIRKKGYNILYVPEAIIGHSYMKSTSQDKTYRIDRQKAKALLLIALRHYKLKSKLAMIKHFLTSYALRRTINSI